MQYQKYEITFVNPADGTVHQSRTSVASSMAEFNLGKRAIAAQCEEIESRGYEVMGVSQIEETGIWLDRNSLDEPTRN